MTGVLSIGLVLSLLTLRAAEDTTPAWDARAISMSQQGVPVTPVLLNSNQGLGENRLMLALFDSERRPVGEASVRAEFYRLAGEPEKAPREAEAMGEAEFTPRSLAPGTDHVHEDGTVHKHVGEPVTVFVATRAFDATGWWGARFTVEIEGQSHRPQITFFVQERTSEPAIGEPAPPSVQATLADAPLEDIDSALPPNPELHELTIAEAVSSGRPSVIAFVTPAFCVTQFCGPVLDQVVLPNWERYGDRVNFVHVEPYDLRRAREGQLVPVDVVREWGLLQEPFIFVVDAHGMVAAKFEGIMEAEELAAAIERVLE
jgi:hypothetical protein